MDDDALFRRFTYEMRTLLTLIETHAQALPSVSLEYQFAGAARDGAETEGAGPTRALSEMARLSRAIAALADAFEATDLSVVANAVASASAEALAEIVTSDGLLTAPLAPLGTRDALAYLRWRVDRFDAAGHATRPDERDSRVAQRIIETLGSSASGHLTALVARGVPTAPPIRLDTSDAGEQLTADELAFLDAFSTAEMLPRDERADAELRRRLSEKPVFHAQSESGGAVPVFGGLTAEQLDEIPPALKRKFVSETEDDVRNIGQLMLAAEERPGDKASLSEMEQLAHKVKGAAATYGFAGLSAIAGAFQATMKALMRHDWTADTSVIMGMGRFLELLDQALLAAGRMEEPDPALVEQATALGETLAAGPASAADVAAHTEQYSPVVAELPEGEDHHSWRHDRDLVLHVEARRLDSIMNQLAALAVNRGAMAHNRGEIARTLEDLRLAIERLRSKTGKIADLSPIAPEVSRWLDAQPHAAQSQEINLSERLQGFTQTTQSASVATAAHEMPSAMASVSGQLRASWDAMRLERQTEMDTALRSLTEVVADVETLQEALSDGVEKLTRLTEAQERLARDMQEDTMRLRLAKLGELEPRLIMNARHAAAAYGKLVNATMTGQDIEIDRSLLTALEDPLAQLARNAMAHGIETPEERAESGKPSTGSFWVRARYEGSDVVIEVGDDGRGINAMAMRGLALSAGLLTAEQARNLPAEQALNLIFAPGLTTAGQPSPFAGSGMGLAGVTSAVQLVKGSIMVSSEPGRGSTFLIRVPVSLSLLQTLDVVAGGQALSLPFGLAQRTLALAPDSLCPMPETVAGGRRCWMLRDASHPDADGVDNANASDIPAYALADALGFAQESHALRYAVIIERQGRREALLVESLGEMRQASVRPLPRALRRRSLRGVIARPEDGSVALLVDPQEALTQWLAADAATLISAPARSPAPREPGPGILIVDDSVTMRRALHDMFTAAGFQTTQVTDGYEALEAMEAETPRVVILDVEMPRLSGFELLTIMRGYPQYAHVRVVMLTSRAADRHREYAMALGADAYLIKPCPQETLIATVRGLLTTPEPS